jgi:hypothetical protein
MLKLVELFSLYFDELYYKIIAKVIIFALKVVKEKKISVKTLKK